MIDYLIDTNVLIRILKGDLALKKFVENLSAAIDSVIYLELIQGAKDKKEVTEIEKYLQRFTIFHFSENVSKQAILLIRIYSKSHGLMLPDAIVAATCLENDLTLLTFNVRDFRFIKNLKILKP